MTVAAQQRMIFGAMCIDEALRYELFEPPNSEVEETTYAKVARLLSGYCLANDFVMDESVVQNVVNIVQLNSPCRLAALAGFAAAKAGVCPCWPC